MLEERIRFAANNNLLGLLDLIASGCEADNAVLFCEVRDVALVGEDASELVVCLVVRARSRVSSGTSSGARGGDAVGSEVVGERSLTRLAGCRDGDTFDQVGHRHFNVELDKVGKGVELNVTGRRW